MKHRSGLLEPKDISTVEYDRVGVDASVLERSHTAEDLGPEGGGMGVTLSSAWRRPSDGALRS